MTRRRTHRGFSLVELVMVLVIIAVVAAVAVPRISRGARGATDSALRTDLNELRNAIKLYQTEHNGAFPKADDIVDQLTRKTDITGTVGTTDGVHIYGPYLETIPGLPVAGEGTAGGRIGDNGVAAADGAGVGWLYTESAGTIVANTGTAADERGAAYSTY